VDGAVTGTWHARICALFAVLAFALVTPGVAHAYEEPNTLTGSGCMYCHPHAGYPAMDCESCHGQYDVGLGGPVNGYRQGNFSGPHGGYTDMTGKCNNCHEVHDAPSGAVTLLIGSTVVGTCFTCHDGTGGWGVYGVIQTRTGTAPAGGHSYEATNVVPGGDAASGGPSTGSFEGPGSTLICIDCHSPHANDVVEPFVGDRRRIRTNTPAIESTRLLKQQPTGASVAVTRYGSDWCLACHAGRASGASVHNHPVESVATVAVPYDYNNLPVLDSDSPTSVTILSTLGGITYADGVPSENYNPHDWPAPPTMSGNRGYLMPYPRTALQSGHLPICQQCHEDSRSVGQLTGDGSVGDAEVTDVWAADGVYWAGDHWEPGWSFDNPSFQNFPHETQNTNMLVEPADDLCTNCHPVVALP
jgi:predicted CXXCH cytochrome family protein